MWECTPQRDLQGGAEGARTGGKHPGDEGGAPNSLQRRIVDNDPKGRGRAGSDVRPHALSPGALHDVLGSGRYPHVQLLPFYELTQPRWRWHFGNCTHRPNGWNYETCCDCTHFCFSPAMWHAHLHSVQQALLQSTGIGQAARKTWV